MFATGHVGMSGGLIVIYEPTYQMQCRPRAPNWVVSPLYFLARCNKVMHSISHRLHFSFKCRGQGKMLRSMAGDDRKTKAYIFRGRVETTKITISEVAYAYPPTPPSICMQRYRFFTQDRLGVVWRNQKLPPQLPHSSESAIASWLCDDTVRHRSLRQHQP